MVQLQKAYGKWSECSKPLPRRTRFAAPYNSIFLNIEEEYQLQNDMLQFLEVIIHLNLNEAYESYCLEIRYSSLLNFVNPIQDRLFRGCSRMGGLFGPPSLKSATHILQ